MKPETCIPDLHMHTTVSDGTDSPSEILEKVKAAGIELFSVTDHDAIKGCSEIAGVRSGSDPDFISGVEFNSRDDEGRYHILGYGYDPRSESIQSVVRMGHDVRMKKFAIRLELLEKEYGFSFPPEEVEALFALDNPGKPHIGNLMVKYGYAKTKEKAIGEYINNLKTPKMNIDPKPVIEGIVGAGGIPVLAHPPYGNGDDLIMGDELDARIKRLMSYGLRGVEGFYSGYSRALRDQVLAIAEKYDLYVTAGSDYHGKNKMVILGDTGIEEVTGRPRGFIRFFEDCPRY